MDTIRVIFTRRRRNPFSWLIRWALPRNRFALALASHSLIVDGDNMIEAHMRHGVCRLPAADAMAGLTVVKIVDYSVPNAEAGLAWARLQIGKPYDWRGALGLVIDVDRNWQKDTDWFCFELVAGALENAGRSTFTETGHITGSMLLSIKP